MRSIKEGAFPFPWFTFNTRMPLFSTIREPKTAGNAHQAILSLWHGVWGEQGKGRHFCLTACFVEDKRPQHSACSTPRFREWFDSYRAGSGDLLFPARCLKRPSCVCSFRDYKCGPSAVPERSLFPFLKPEEIFSNTSSVLEDEGFRPASAWTPGGAE